MTIDTPTSGTSVVSYLLTGRIPDRRTRRTRRLSAQNHQNSPFPATVSKFRAEFLELPGELSRAAGTQDPPRSLEVRPQLNAATRRRTDRIPPRKRQISPFPATASTFQAEFLDFPRELSRAAWTKAAPRSTQVRPKLAAASRCPQAPPPESVVGFVTLTRST